MMRDLAKSMFRLGWAVGILGVDQVAGLVSRDRDLRDSSHSLDTVSRAASSQLGGTMKKVYDAGEHLQAGMIETVTGMADTSARRATGDAGTSWNRLDRTHSLHSDPVGDRPPAEPGPGADFEV